MSCLKGECRRLGLMVGLFINKVKEHVYRNELGKVCSACGEFKFYDEFPVENINREPFYSKLGARCCECKNKYNRESYKKTIQHQKERKRKYYKENKDIYAKRAYKRKRELGFLKIMPNVFPNNIKVNFHHIDNLCVIPLPQKIHQRYNGYSRDEHREKLDYYVKMYYGDLNVGD